MMIASRTWFLSLAVILMALAAGCTESSPAPRTDARLDIAGSTDAPSTDTGDARDASDASDASDAWEVRPPDGTRGIVDGWPSRDAINSCNPQECAANPGFRCAVWDGDADSQTACCSFEGGRFRCFE